MALTKSMADDGRDWNDIATNYSSTYTVAMAHEMIPIVGKVVAVGPVELGDDTTYIYITIERDDGSARHFETVRALPELSGLVERDTAGTFVFLNSPNECRLAFVYRDHGARQADCEAMNAYFDEQAATATEARGSAFLAQHT
jgi:hypothetical protein